MAAAVTGTVWLTGARLFAFPGKSMAPTVMPGDYFVGLVGMWGLRAPERFEMVIFDVPPTSKWAERRIPWMKRVVGLPGERIQLSGAQLFVDGQEMAAPFLHLDRAAEPQGGFEMVLKSDEYFVLGDNLDHSFDDSRTMGPISKSLIRGFVAFVIHKSKPEKPNKAPEPTPTAVTSRATCISESMTIRKARLAPAAVVAHL